MTPAIQGHGELDVLLRCYETEISASIASGSADPHFRFNYLNMLSELWILSVYETVRTVNQRKIVAESDAFENLYLDLTLVRMPLAKHEIPKDNLVKSPLNMTRVPSNAEAGASYVYDKGDPLRSHIMPCGVSANGSLMWQVIDLKRNIEYWVERRGLSDRILAFAVPVNSA
ncbi:hypothetical protein ABS772_23670 [Methylorubrum podarium]|uniref:Uncharacterized protein n=1 Tax=Methylorubrum podarium TaxID=200476 RepID=A0ABV1QUJ5_9HYPH